MLEYTVRRVLQMIPVVIGITLIAFLIFHLDPRDPVTIFAGEGASSELVEQVRVRLGLDQPPHVQYWRFVSRLVQGDLGISFRSRMPVTTDVWPALLATFHLAAFAILFTVMIGVPVGILSATRPYTLADNVAMSTVLVGLSAPLFWTGILMIYVFSYQLGWFPSGGRRTAEAVLLPALTMGFHYGAILARITRATMLEVLNQDYIRTARSKGLAEGTIQYKHALRNAAITIVTAMGLQLGGMLGGTILIEIVFSWPGIGRLLVNAIFERDAPVVQVGVIFVALLVSFINLLVDLSYGYINPKIRLS